MSMWSITPSSNIMTIKLAEDISKLYNCMDCHKRVIPRKEGGAFIEMDKEKGKIHLCKKCFEKINKRFSKVQ
jgi:DNA-directed RNA polymerase subunit RPC12/RpoP